MNTTILTGSSNTDRVRGTGGEKLTQRELAAWRGLLASHAATIRDLDAELTAEHGLSLSAYEVLLFLVDAPGGARRMSDLAAGVLLSRSGLTRLVDRLEQEGLVRRVPCPSDARGLNAVITDAGRKAFARARKTHLAGVRRLFLERYEDAELDVLGDLLARTSGSEPDGTC